jgi:hypothetical protein
MRDTRRLPRKSNLLVNQTWPYLFFKKQTRGEGKKRLIKDSKKPERRSSERIKTLGELWLRALFSAGLRTKNIPQGSELLWKQDRYVDELKQTEKDAWREKMLTRVSRKLVSRSCTNLTSRDFNLFQTCSLPSRHISWILTSRRSSTTNQITYHRLKMQQGRQITRWGKVQEFQINLSIIYVVFVFQASWFLQIPSTTEANADKCH